MIEKKQFKDLYNLHIYGGWFFTIKWISEERLNMSLSWSWKTQAWFDAHNYVEKKSHECEEAKKHSQSKKTI